MRLLAGVTAALLLSGSIAGAATIRASTGARAEVSGSYASNFQCLVSGLEAAGYRIDFMGGLRGGHGSSRHKHPLGMALDINQTSRGRVTRSLPGSATSIATSCGLFHGAQWCSQDQGHFEAGGSTVCGGRWSTRHSHRTRRPAASPPSSGFHWPWEH